jgi:hypothetical protein
MFSGHVFLPQKACDRGKDELAHGCLLNVEEKIEK